MREYENALFPDPVKLLALSTACLVSSKVLMKSALVITKQIEREKRFKTK
jgi:hypothetical protein